MLPFVVNKAYHRAYILTFLIAVRHQSGNRK